MSIFDKDRIGRRVRCVVEKDGVQVIEFVKWIHASLGFVVARKINERIPAKSEEKNNHYKIRISKGWKVVKLDVEKGFDLALRVV